MASPLYGGAMTLARQKLEESVDLVSHGRHRLFELRLDAFFVLLFPGLTLLSKPVDSLHVSEVRLQLRRV